MMSSRFFASASTSGADPAGRVPPTAQTVRDLVLAIRSERNGRTNTDRDETSDDAQTTCAICLDTPTVPAKLSGNDEDARGCAKEARHVFCLDCIERWASVTNRCPLCKVCFWQIKWKDENGVERSRVVEPRKLRPDTVSDNEALDQVLASELERIENTFCEACGDGDDEANILLCDSCDAGFHTKCCWPPLPSVPDDEWFCPACDGVAYDETAVLEWPEGGRLRPRFSVAHQKAVAAGHIPQRRYLARPEWRRRREWYQAWQWYEQGYPWCEAREKKGPGSCFRFDHTRSWLETTSTEGGGSKKRKAQERCAESTAGPASSAEKPKKRTFEEFRFYHKESDK